MKKYIILLGILGVLGMACLGCREVTIGFLNVENASYTPDSLFIPKKLDPNNREHQTRLLYQSPWMTLKMEGYEGTQQIIFTVESVTSSAGEEAARVFQEELTIRGGGALIYPLEHKAVTGEYIVSVRLTNPGYTAVVKDAYKFILE